LGDRQINAIFVRMLKAISPCKTFGFILLISLAGCKVKKKSSSNVVDGPIILLDTLNITANEAPKKVIYRGTPDHSCDIIHTRLDVNFIWAKSQMNGKATIDAKQYFYPSNMVYLDARGMEIKSVKVYELNTQPVELSNTSFTYERDSLKINLGRVFTSNEKFRLVIDYISKPNELKSGGSAAINSDKGLYFINPTGENPHKMPQIWTQGETESNSVWFPTVDNPIEKMTQEIWMTVDDKYITLSNGSLIESKKNADGTRTDHWKLDQPHSPYLAMMAVGQFKKIVDEPWNGKEISYYVEKEYEPHAKAIFGDTREMIEFFSTRLGVPYAWPKYSQIAVRDYVSGAMENTSATLHGDFSVYQTTRETIDGKKGNDVIAHELFHQWFGDLVTSESWSNLPLNESFATYGEYMWNEFKFGRDLADHHHLASRSGYIFSEGEVNLIRFEYEGREDMFDNFSYNKGGQVLHMLRKAVGDDAFYASLKNYLQTNRHKTAEIHNLRLAFEETTGKDMNWFFNQWFLSPGRPKLKVTKKYDAAKSEIELTVVQYQNFSNTPVYTLPIDIDIYTDGAPQRTRILIDQVKQTFKIKCNTEPKLLNFDAERQLLCDLNYSKTKAEYIFQMNNAPLYEDRIEALANTEDEFADAAVYEMYKQAAVKDKSAFVRNRAIRKFENVSAERETEVKKLLISIYANDKTTTTRAEALRILNKSFPNDKEVLALNDKALGETSYAIIGEALEAEIKRDPKTAMEKAKQFEQETGDKIIFPIAGLYGDLGSDEQIPFFANNMRYMSGFEMVTFMSDYAKAAKRCKTSRAALTAASDMEWVAREGGKYSRYGTMKGISDLFSIWETREKDQLAAIENAKKDKKDVSAMETELKTITETKEQIAKIYSRCN
jgi:aminopeptidase N